MKRYQFRIPIFTAILLFCLLALSGCGGKKDSYPSITMGEISEFRPTFTVEQPPAYDVLNSITNNSVIGDERQFVRIYDAAGTEYASTVELQPHQIYEVRMYLINDSSDDNGKVENTYGYAKIPDAISEYGAIFCEISCDGTYPVPERIFDSVTVTATQELRLTYIADSAKQYVAGANGKCDWIAIDSVNDFFTGQSRIGYGDRNKDKWYVYQGAEELQYVTFAFFTEPVKTTNANNDTENNAGIDTSVPPTN